jgi:hypothetical protein
VPLPAGDPRGAELVGALRARADARQALRGVAKISIDAQRGSARASNRLAVARPSHMRLEVLGILDQITAILATDGERFDLFRVEEGTIETGEVHAGILWEVARIPLAPEDAVDVMLGAPLPPDATAAGGTRRPDGELEIDVADGSGALRRRLRFDPQGNLRRVAAYDGWQAPAWVAHYDDYRELDGGPFAFAISLEFPDAETEAELTFQKVELNPELAPGIFRLPAPRGHGS